MRTTSNAVPARRVAFARNTACHLTAWFLVFAALGGGLRATAQEADKDENAPKEEAQAEDATAPVTLVVENQNWADMRVYAVKSGTRYRLGEVISFTKVTFDLPRHLMAESAELRFLAIPLGGSSSVLSPRVYASSGDQIVWALQNHLALSGMVLRGRLVPSR